MRSAVGCTVEGKPFTEIPTRIHTLKEIKDFSFFCSCSVSLFANQKWMSFIECFAFKAPVLNPFFRSLFSHHGSVLHD